MISGSSPSPAARANLVGASNMIDNAHKKRDREREREREREKEKERDRERERERKREQTITSKK